MNYQRTPRTNLTSRFAVFVTIVFLCLLIMPAQATRFPASDTAAGMWVDYSVSGATITSDTETNGRFGEWKTIVKGTVNPGADKIVISGTAYQSSGYYATVDVGDKSLGSIDRPAYPPKAFTVEVPVPKDGSLVSTGIWMTGSYDAGSRYLTVSMKFDNPSAAAAPVPATEVSYTTTTEETYVPFTYATTTKPVTTTRAAAAACDRMSVDIEEVDMSGSPFSVLVKVTDLCEGNPVPDSTLEYRVFHTSDNTQCIQYNGVFADFGPESCPSGRCLSTFRGTEGDTYRIDVYASKEGWNDADTSLHVTPGGDPGICRTYTTGQGNNNDGAGWNGGTSDSALSGSGSSHYGASAPTYETYDFSDAPEEPVSPVIPVLAFALACVVMVGIRRRNQ